MCSGVHVDGVIANSGSILVAGPQLKSAHTTRAFRSVGSRKSYLNSNVNSQLNSQVKSALGFGLDGGLERPALAPGMHTVGWASCTARGVDASGVDMVMIVACAWRHGAQ